jgi:hypothetical protein
MVVWVDQDFACRHCPENPPPKPRAISGHGAAEVNPLCPQLPALRGEIKLAGLGLLPFLGNWQASADWLCSVGVTVVVMMIVGVAVRVR